MSQFPKPVSERPWTQQPDKPTIYDRHLKPVSFIQNAPFLFAVEQCHDDLVKACQAARAELLLGRSSPKVIELLNRALDKAGAS